MKKTLILLSVLMSGAFAKADVLLTCSVNEKDLKAVVVESSEQGLVLTEVTHRNKATRAAITREEFENKNIRLSNSQIGFRYLRYTYSEYFNEVGWFVESNSGFGYSIGHADCK